MSQLRDNLRLFERLSRQPSYWEDRELAEEQSRRAASTRTLWESFDAVRAQAEAAEELAYEAYGLRAGHSAKELTSALHGAREAFEPLTERLYASLFPPTDAATITLVPGRGAQRWTHWLASIYSLWAQKRGLNVDFNYLWPKTDEQKKSDEAAAARAAQTRRTSSNQLERILQQQGLIAAIKHYRDKSGASLKEAKEYVERIRDALETPRVTSHEWRTGAPAAGVHWEAMALHIQGESLPMLLSAEHGSHRFNSQGETHTVKVRFQPGKVKLRDLGQPDQLEVTMPNAEIRRIWPERKGQEHGLLRDLRTETEHDCTPDGFSLSEVLAAWIRFRVFGAQETQWI
jgi:hypothetical protein